MDSTPPRRPVPPKPKVEVVDPTRDTIRERLGLIAWVLDSAIPIPGTKIRFGLDALIGLIPGVGDAVGAAISSYILGEAAALGVPRTTLIRMSMNIAIEAVIGVIPFFGDLFDVAWKANVKNVNLLNAWLDNPTRTARASKGFVALLIGAIILLVIGLGVVAVWLVALLIGAIQQAA